MWIPSPEQLKESNESAAFILFSWEEFFSNRSPDSFQIRLHNIPSLVVELHEIAQRAITVSRWEKHVKKIQEELQSAFEDDKQFLSLFMPARYGWTIKKLCQITSVSEIATAIDTMPQVRHLYETQAIVSLRTNCVALPKAKVAVYWELQRLATIAFQKGLAYYNFRSLFSPENLKRDVDGIIDQLAALINAPPSSNLCVLAVQGDRRELQVIGRKVGFELVGNMQFQTGTDGHQFFSETSTYVHLAATTTAKHPFQAAQLAVQKLRPALDIFNFYQHGALSVKDAVLVIPEGGETAIIRGERQWKWQVRNRKSALGLTKGLLDSASDGRFSGQILNALEHYSLSQSSDAVRIKLVNLWSALECLTTEGNSDSIIGQVCQAVVPAVTWRRTAKILSYIAKTLSKQLSAFGGSALKFVSFAFEMPPLVGVRISLHAKPVAAYPYCDFSPLNTSNSNPLVPMAKARRKCILRAHPKLHFSRKAKILSRASHLGPHHLRHQF